MRNFHLPNFCVFRPHLAVFQGSLLALHSGIPPGEAWGTTWGSEDQTPLGHTTGKALATGLSLVLHPSGSSIPHQAHQHDAGCFHSPSNTDSRIWKEKSSFLPEVPQMDLDTESVSTQDDWATGVL